MPPPRSHDGAPVWVVGSHRLARSLLAEHLAASLQRHVDASGLDDLGEATVIVVLAAYEALNTLPRVLRHVSLRGARVILSHDATATTAQEVQQLADSFGIWAVVDVRGDIRALVDLVQRALSTSARSAGQPSAPALARWSLPSTTTSLSLTVRERDIVRLLCGDAPMSTEAAAMSLGISVHTVNTHLRNIRRKLGSRYTGNRDALRDALAQRRWLD